jgi:quinol monooxygenase YgiN
MVHLVIRHDVVDYETWRARFDEAVATGLVAARGIREHSVYRDEHDPNNVTVMFGFDDMDAAESYVMNPDNKRILESYGVKPGGMVMSFADA